MTYDEIAKYRELQSKVESETYRILFCTAASNSSEDIAIESIVADNGMVEVIWHDVEVYERCRNEFPFSYYTMTDDEIRDSWEADKDKLINMRGI